MLRRHSAGVILPRLSVRFRSWVGTFRGGTFSVTVILTAAVNCFVYATAKFLTNGTASKKCINSVLRLHFVCTSSAENMRALEMTVGKKSVVFNFR